MLKKYFQESDVSGTLALLSTCAPHYLDGALRPGAGGRGQVLSLLLFIISVIVIIIIYYCCYNDQVPPGCRQHNAVYTILHYLTDTDFPSTKVTIIIIIIIITIIIIIIIITIIIIFIMCPHGCRTTK